jgi:thiol-disulfide isomerase/thioredoxin
VLLWALALVEGLIIVALMRQIGVLLLRVGTATAFDVGRGPNIAEPAPWLPDGLPPDHRRGFVLVFLSSGCGICDLLAPGLNALQSTYSREFWFLAVGRESAEVLRSWAQKHRLRVPIMSSTDAFQAYEIEGTPYAFVIDDQRRVRARGGVNHTDQLEALLRLCLAAESEVRGEEEPDPHVAAEPPRTRQARGVNASG